ncbi:MAG: GTPase domain-containing protein [Nostoc sp. ChiSLP01]|nr:GTPase domain-containing protein [Nostoc sp. CmiSLP01]MDZ8287854.1 GTPase domain-containing protein [Nostoc sp. ChiSLP01]
MNYVPRFNLLTIGHRGVGKTVFLAGSYAELHADTHKQKMWFDCSEPQVQENINNILSYISETAHYPPATMKITNFRFSLNRRSWWGTETVCNFSWSDVPGEICTIRNHDFRAMVSNSDGCCVFIDAYALMSKGKAYIEFLEEIVKQVMAIASVAYLHDRHYPFVLILTKCDLLKSDRLAKDLEELIKPLTTRLDAVKAEYKIFYSLIPIARTLNSARLEPKGAAAPILSLVWELAQADRLNLIQDHSPIIPSLWSNVLQNFQSFLDQLLQKPQVKTTSEPFGVQSESVKVSFEGLEVRRQQQSNQGWIANCSKPKNIIAVALAGMTLVGLGLTYRYIKLSEPCSSENCLLLNKGEASDSYSTKNYKNTETD